LPLSCVDTNVLAPGFAYGVFFLVFQVERAGGMVMRQYELEGIKG